MRREKKIVGKLHEEMREKRSRDIQVTRKTFVRERYDGVLMLC